MTITIQEIYNALAHAIGKPVERSWIGGGSVFVIEQGDDMFLLDRDMWVLWLHNTAWCLEQANNKVATSEDEREKMEQAAILLDDKILLQIEIAEISLGLTLKFSDDITVTTFTPKDHQMPPWLWFLPHGFVITTDESNTLIHRRSHYAAAIDP